MFFTELSGKDALVAVNVQMYRTMACLTAKSKCQHLLYVADVVAALIAEYDRVHVGAPGGARKLMQDAPAVNRWIPCSERLPEVYEKVLTYNDEGIIHDNFRLNLRDGSVGWSQGWGITHWQPRPEPPEKE